MNSILIKQKFGSYGVDVIAQESHRRVASLYSLSDGQPVTRTLAIVDYASGRPATVEAVHAQILDGASIGQSFLDHGFEVIKETVRLMELPSSPGMAALYDMMQLSREANLAYHSYRLKVRKHGDWTTYAQVTEIHSPEHLDIGELAERLEEDTYYRERHPMTLEVLEEFRAFLDRYVGPSRLRAAN